MRETQVSESKRKIPAAITRKLIVDQFVRRVGRGAAAAMTSTAKYCGVPVGTVELVIARELDAREREVAIFRRFTKSALDTAEEVKREVWSDETGIRRPAVA